MTSGVVPFTSLASISAPSLRSTLITSVCPRVAAQWIGCIPELSTAASMDAPWPMSHSAISAEPVNAAQWTAVAPSSESQPFSASGCFRTISSHISLEPERMAITRRSAGDGTAIPLGGVTSGEGS
eukprot:scaffold167865_cov35-Tisochrysis_lutea.AAC.2